MANITDSDQWYVRGLFLTVDGPFKNSTIVKMAESGKITAGTYVSTEKDGPWMLASEFDELKFKAAEKLKKDFQAAGRDIQKAGQKIGHAGRTMVSAGIGCLALIVGCSAVWMILEFLST